MSLMGIGNKSTEKKWCAVQKSLEFFIAEKFKKVNISVNLNMKK